MLWYHLKNYLIHITVLTFIGTVNGEEKYLHLKLPGNVVASYSGEIWLWKRLCVVLIRIFSSRIGNTRKRCRKNNRIFLKLKFSFGAVKWVETNRHEYSKNYAHFSELESVLQFYPPQNHGVPGLELGASSPSCCSEFGQQSVKKFGRFRNDWTGIIYFRAA